MSPKPNSPNQPSGAPGAGATLDQWLAYLESIHPKDIDLGLDRVLLVLRRLFPRKPEARIITVAGTNGKGSTVACIEALLRARGRTTGAYTSPHLHRYNERVRLNGQDISDEAMVRALDRVEQARQGTSLTYFEFGTLAAFVAFQEAGVEDWILEVGLGGRLDAVNALDADCAVISSVDLDHVEYLGNDREVIGFEKAGILRPGIPAVYADLDIPRSVLQQVAAQNVKLSLLGRDYRILEPSGDSRPYVTLEIGAERLTLPSGPLPVTSMAAAAVLIRLIEPSMTIAQIEWALSGLRVPGRFEKLASEPDVFADVGHNPHAARWLAGRLKAQKMSGRKTVAVYGALGDKDVEGVVRAMANVVDQWLLAPLAVPRGLNAYALAHRVAQAGVDNSAISESVASAIELGRAQAGPDGAVIVFGSFFTVAEARQSLACEGS